jgi:hypothetical protein
MTMRPFLKLLRWASVLLFLVLFGTPACAAELPGLTVSGGGQSEQHFTAEDLQKFPQTQVSVSYVTANGQETGSYSGVLLWTLLGKALMADSQNKGALLRHVITVTGRDGHAVVLSSGEIAPNFEGKSVILAIVKDGQPLPVEIGIRLIVPGDKHGGRAVRDVVKIDVQ